MSNYYQPEIETMPYEELRQLQNARFMKQVRHVWDNVPYYRQKMEAKGVTIDDIQSLDDLHKLPFLKKDDLRDQYPYGLLAKPLSDCVRIQSTSGTTGRRVVAFYTQNDVDLWEDCCARAITAVGGTKDDVVQVAYGYGLFTGGAGMHGGSHKVGCLTLPMSSGNTDRQLQFMTDLGATILCCTPSYALLIADTAIEMGYDPAVDFPISACICGAEPASENMRQEIADKRGVQYCDVYGLSEIMGPGVAMECAERGGLHIAEDQFYCEIVDPDTGAVLPEGEWGELVITTLTRECSPMIRYRTRDVTRIVSEPCACGRTHRKIDRLRGRTDDMLIVKGVNFYPRQVEQALKEIPGVADEFQIILEERHGMTEVTINVEASEGVTGHTVAKHLRERLGSLPKGHVFPLGSLPRTEGKAKRVIKKVVE